MKEVTIEHIRWACEWAKKATTPTPIDGHRRRYSQDEWDCGTSCCIWGAAWIIAGNPPPANPPTDAWGSRNLRHVLLTGLLRSMFTTLEQLLALLDATDFTNANLVHANLSHMDLSNTNLAGCNLRNADLTNTNLAGCNLRNADLTNTCVLHTNLAGAQLAGAKYEPSRYLVFF